MAENMVPQSRAEEILIATINGTEYTVAPQSRLEYLLLELKDVIEEGSGGGSVHFVVVEELPTTDIDQSAIYLVPKSTAATSNVYDEYINTDGTTSGWELIGTTDIDLSDYITDDDLATVLEDYATTQDLSGKQDTLTAGKYINIDANDEISVNPVVPNESFTYTIKQIDDYSFEIIKTVDNVVVFDEVYSCYDPVAQQQIDVNETFDDAINIQIYPAGERSYTLLIASDAHEAGFKQTTPWWQRNTFVENFSTVDHSGEKLIVKSELDTALTSKQNVIDNTLQTTSKTVVGAVNELKSGLTNYQTQNDLNLEVPNRKNLCDNDKNEVGYYDQTGTYQVDAHFATSDLIPVEQGKTYVASIFNKTTSERIGGLVYSTWDASKNFVAQSTSASITIGSGVSYVRIRNFQDQTSFIDGNNYVYQLEQGSTATAYAPYIPSVESRIEAVESGLTDVELSFQSHDVSGADIAEILTNLLLWVRDSLGGGRTYVLSGVFTNTTSTSSEDYNAVITKKSTHMYGMVSSGNFIYNTNYTAGVYRGLYKFEGTSLI